MNLFSKLFRQGISQRIIFQSIGLFYLVPLPPGEMSMNGHQYRLLQYMPASESSLRQ